MLVSTLCLCCACTAVDLVSWWHGFDHRLRKKFAVMLTTNGRSWQIVLEKVSLQVGMTRGLISVYLDRK